MKQCGCGKNLSCGCCEGVESLTPQPTANRPGLNSLRYRVGTHATFFETMRARLGNFRFEDSEAKANPLADLKTRLPDDPAIALLSAAAEMLDVLTFYQERIANEGFLRTATERRSVLELGRLVGYTPRPGVSASVYLAYTLDDKSEPVEIPLGALAQSVPMQNELPQSFETSEKLQARKEWNNLQPRMSKPQKITFDNVLKIETVYFDGTETNLKTNDPLLFVFEDRENRKNRQVIRRVRTITPQFDANRTLVALQIVPAAAFNARDLMDELLRILDGFPADSPVNKEILRVAAETIKQNIRLGSYPRNAESKDIDALIRSLEGESTGQLKIILEELKRLENPQTIDKAELLEKLEAIMKDSDEQTAKQLRTIIAKFRDLDIVKPEHITALIDELEAIVKGLEKQIPKELRAILERLKNLADTPVVPVEPNVRQTNLNLLFARLSASPSLQPANSLRLPRTIQQVFNHKSDIRNQLLINFRPTLAETLYPALSNAAFSVVQPDLKAVYVLRVTAPLFGYNAPMVAYEVKRNEQLRRNEIEPKLPPVEPDIANESGNLLFLDSAYDKITASDERELSYTVVNRLDKGATLLFQIREAQIRPRTDYGLSGKITALTLDKNWWTPFADKSERKFDKFDTIRRTIVHTHSERLALADEPLNDDVCGERIELGELYEGLRAGQWLIVSGERTDVGGVRGIMASELVMLAGVKQISKGGDKKHTVILLAGRNASGEPGLQYRYKRDAVKIYGNVVKATHGETRNEVLGSGSAAQPMQTFALKQPPLTYVSAPTASGIESTLRVRVNDVEWREADSLAELAPNDRKFITKTDDETKISIVFGNGEQGARLPTGVENIRAVYRSGIGKTGNVKAGQISLPLTKPLGVKEVVNPLRASGGADKETRDQARRNVPIALMALDRLVSTQDYADFARNFAGIGKSSVVRLSDGYRQVLHLTIAGAEDVPIDANSELRRNLRRSLAKNGDAFLPVQVASRELIALVIAARVSIRAEYLWEKVAVKIRATLLETFSFERRALGQSVFLSEVVSAIQSVEGVAYSDVDVLDGISESELDKGDLGKIGKSPPDANRPNQFVQAKLARRNTVYKPQGNSPQNAILPAQLAYLTPDVPDTLILNKIEEVRK